jgi:uncharacterized protein (DUF2236 family)
VSTRSHPFTTQVVTEQDRFEDEGDGIDFERCMTFVRSNAAGDVAGVFGSDSVSWKLAAEPLYLLAGTSAVLLQMAHPAVVSGVSSHSNFARDVMARAKRTVATLYQFVFGDLKSAIHAAHRLHKIHRSVRGVIDEPKSPTHGERYRANDQALLKWVGLTTTVMGRKGFETFVRPLTSIERTKLERESRVSFALSGVLPEHVSGRYDDLETEMHTRLQRGDLVVGDAARTIAKALFDFMNTRGPVEEIITAGLLPAPLRDAFGLRWDAQQQSRFDRIADGLRRWHAVAPTRYRYVVAWHQAMVRTQRAEGKAPSLWSRSLDALGHRWNLPTSLFVPRNR